MSEEARKLLEDTMTGIGAACEIVGFLRDNLIRNGFTREEAVMMSTEALLELLTLGRED